MQVDAKPANKRRVNITLAAVLVIIVVGVGVAGYRIFIGGTPSSTNSSGSPTQSSNTQPTTQATTSNSGLQTTFSTIILGGTAPSNYTFGNIIDGGLISGMTWLDVSQGYAASFRFTAPKSGTVTQVMVHGQNLSGIPHIEVGLQQDASGDPSGQWLGGQSNFGVANNLPELGWVTIGLPSPVQVQKGQVLHVVVEATPDSTGDFGVTVYPGYEPYQPLNATNPDLNWRDNQINSLKEVGSTWTVENKYPVFTLNLADGSAMGQPYSLAAPWGIFGGTYVGQEMIPTMNYNLGKIAFVIATNGLPKDSLYYTIYDASNNVLAHGNFSSPRNLGVVYVWQSVTLPQPVSLTAGHLYRIVLSSPGSDKTGLWQLIGFEFSSNYSIGYGGLQNEITSSLDAGSSWSPWYDADAMFRFTTA